MFEKKIINLEVDIQFNVLHGCLVSTLPQTIEFYIWELIFSYGSKKSSLFNPSWLNKIFLFDHLIERILDDRNFKVSINQIRNHFGSEELKNASEAYGEAFALLLVQKLFNTKLEKIKKIRIAGANKRADYEGVTETGQSIVFEAKGTISPNTLVTQIANGKRQLNTHNANIKALMGTLIQEDSRSKVVVIDPPGVNFNYTRREMMAIEAEGLARLFNFLGHKELSEYFYLMKRRLSNENFDEVAMDKEEIFQKIKAEYTPLTYGKRQFKGHLTKFSNKNYIFIGIDESLIYFQEFLNSSINDQFISDKANNAILYRNKILVKQVSLSSFESKPKIFDFLDNAGIYDFHYMPTDACLNLLEKILSSVGLDVTQQDGNIEIYNPQSKKRTLIVFSKFFLSDKEKLRARIRKMQKQLKEKYNKNMSYLLITPNKIDLKVDGIKVLDRSKLKLCLENRDLFLNYF